MTKNPDRCLCSVSLYARSLLSVLLILSRLRVEFLGLFHSFLFAATLPRQKGTNIHNRNWFPRHRFISASRKEEQKKRDTRPMASPQQDRCSQQLAPKSVSPQRSHAHRPKPPVKENGKSSGADRSSRNRGEIAPKKRWRSCLCERRCIARCPPSFPLTNRTRGVYSSRYTTRGVRRRWPAADIALARLRIVRLPVLRESTSRRVRFRVECSLHVALYGSCVHAAENRSAQWYLACRH